MKANTSIGELAIHTAKGQSYLLRPSFRAVQALGDADEIAYFMQSAFSTMQLMAEGKSAEITPERMIDCAYILDCFNSNPDGTLAGSMPERLTGHIIESGKWKTYGKESIDPSDLIVIANHCIKWGMCGDPKSKPKQSKKSSDEESRFDPSVFVGIAQSDWGMSTADAWGMTLTEFQRAFEAKYPDKAKSKAGMTQDEAAANRERCRESRARLPKERGKKVNFRGKAAMRESRSEAVAKARQANGKPNNLIVKG